LNDTSNNQNAEGGSVILRPDIQRLSTQIIRLAGKADDRDQLFIEYLQFSIGLINAAGAILFKNDNDGLVSECELLSRQALQWSDELASIIQESARLAISTQQVQHSALEKYPAVKLISCPTGNHGNYSGCLSFVVLTAEQPIESFLVIIQLLTALLSFLIREKGSSGTSIENKYHHLSTIAAHSLEATNQQEALLQLNTELRTWAGCDHVVIGTPTASGRLLLSSISHISNIDQRTEQARAYQKALNECTIRKEILCYPGADDNAIQSSPVLKDLLNATESNQVIAFPLRATHGNIVGAILFFWTTPADRRDISASLNSGKDILAACLFAIQDKSSYRLGARLRDTGSTKRSRFLKPILTIGSLLLLFAVNFIPVPFRLNTDCLVQPVSIRFIVSRFDGILQNVLVQPGDHVEQGDVLARLDGRDIEIDQAARAAELKKARKTRDHYLADGNTAAAQIAELDGQRIDQQLNLLQEKEKHLTLASPIDGIILTGDMKRIEGSPVGRGQTLFEVSPLNTMIVELAVRETHISYLEPGMMVTVRFDAFPETTWDGAIEKINPKSKIRENRNVFIAELEFENPDEKLRPGMQGKAKVDAGLKPLGWILFRKPWYSFLKLKDFIF